MSVQNTGRARQPQRRAQDTRAVLIAAAAEEFARHGYTGASISIILERSGRTKGAMYFHFPSKNALAEAILTEADQMQTDLARRWLTAQISPLDALVAMITDLGALQEGDLIARAAARLAFCPELRHQTVQRTSAVWEAVAHELLAKAAMAGDVDDPGSVGRWVPALSVMLAGVRFRAYTATDPPGLAVGYAECVETICAAATADRRT